MLLVVIAIMCSRSSHCYSQGVTGGGEGGYSGFQVTWMIEGFLEFEIFEFGICLGRKILAGIVFFG